jgi:hypothetical protein
MGVGRRRRRGTHPRSQLTATGTIIDVADIAETRPGKFTTLAPEDAWIQLVIRIAESDARLISHTPTRINAVSVKRRTGSCLAMLVMFGFGFIPGVYYMWWLSVVEEHPFTITLVPTSGGTTLHGDGAPAGLELAHRITDQVLLEA